MSFVGRNMPNHYMGGHRGFSSDDPISVLHMNMKKFKMLLILDQETRLECLEIVNIFYYFFVSLVKPKFCVFFQ